MYFFLNHRRRSCLGLIVNLSVILPIISLSNGLTSFILARQLQLLLCYGVVHPLYRICSVQLKRRLNITEA